jgi:hypothetical protein
MYIYASHMLTAWMSDATHGVNAVLPTVPRLPGDSVPPAVTIVQAMRDGESGQAQAPLTGLPALQIMPVQRATQRMSPSVQPYPSDMQVTVTIRYIAANSTETDRMLRDTEYTMLALDTVLARLFRGQLAAAQALKDSYFSLYGAQFVSAESTEWDTGYLNERDTKTTAMLNITLRGRFQLSQS